MSNLWEERWRAGDTGWDHGEAAPPLVDWLSRHSPSGRVLVPGCGSGHDVRALAAASPELEVTGLDIAPSAIAKAERIPSSGCISWRVGDFLEPAPDLRAAFDLVFEHTCFCALDPSLRDKYVCGLNQVLRPGGYYLAIFYLDPISPNGPPFRVSREELDERFGEFELLEQYVPTVGYKSRLGREEVRLYRKPA
jgi:SAM-dependent methyltransferase